MFSYGASMRQIPANFNPRFSCVARHNSRMRLVPAILCLTVLHAQDRPPATQPPAPPIEPTARDSRIEGQVLADGNSVPLRRARVTLESLEAGAPILVETDDRGSFAIRDIAPGAYRLIARRDGYLESSQT